MTLTSTAGADNDEIPQFGSIESKGDLPELAEPVESKEASLWEGIATDHRYFYSLSNAGWLAAGCAAGALMANTAIDSNFNDFYQENIRNATSDDWSEALHVPKVLGNGWATIPLFAGAYAAGELLSEHRAASLSGEWGSRSARTILVGAPPMLLMQVVTGGSRPGETSHDAHWQPWRDNNGVSGHSFMGAVPFLSAAKMTDDPWLKAGFYLGSSLAGLSRVNDNHHYLSQAVLGWWMAYLAATSVDQTFEKQTSLQVAPFIENGAQGLGLGYRW